jgi:hypothetical protein
LVERAQVAMRYLRLGRWLGMEERDSAIEFPIHPEDERSLPLACRQLGLRRMRATNSFEAAIVIKK